MYEITQRLFALEEDALELLDNSETLRTGHLKISASFPNLPTQFILPFREKYPGVDVSLVLSNSANVLRDVKDCRVDIGFLGGTGGYTRCNTQLLARPKIVLVAQKNHPCAKKASSASKK